MSNVRTSAKLTALTGPELERSLTQALSNLGLTVVPIKPTRHMLNAAMEFRAGDIKNEAHEEEVSRYEEMCIGIWTRMINSLEDVAE